LPVWRYAVYLEDLVAGASGQLGPASGGFSPLCAAPVIGENSSGGDLFYTSNQ
jgi:hypothetical protein